MTNKKFLQTLKSEYDKFSKDGTSYRKTTAYMAFSFMKFINDYSFLKDRNLIKQKLIEFSITKDEHRLNDLAKYLHILYRYQELDNNISQEMKNELEKKRKLREGKQITLILVQ